MKVTNILRLAGSTALLLAAASIPATAQTAKAELKDSKGKVVASADLTQTQAGVLVRLSASGLPPGEHAFHIHTVGKCEPPFESAGPHFNPTNQHHGMLFGQGHAGDMPNLYVPTSGALTVEVLDAAITLDRNKPNSVFQPGGTALVIHAKPDDYKTDPAGNAGDRIACGVIGEGAATVGASPGH